MTDKSTSSTTASIGVAGLGVMGKNLAINIESRGFHVAVWNRNGDKTRELMAEMPTSRFVPSFTPADFVNSMARPRAIILMLTAGSAIDSAIETFLPLLDKGDIIIDGGNSWYEDTDRREARLQKDGFHYVGLGVSGGEEGARLGPSLMPGGTEYAYNAISKVLNAIAAQTDSGACVTHVGPGGAGHFVKMVHNGIEYADMQLIAEAYHLLCVGTGKDAAALSALFAKYNAGPLSSFLIELTAKVLGVKDPITGNALVDMILDKAGQKGTGKWTNQAALALGVPVPSIAAAVDARILSSMKETRVAASKIFVNQDAKPDMAASVLESEMEKALLAAKIIAYAQGLDLISKASDEFKWNVSLKESARIWKGGCIIRATLLDTIMTAYDKGNAPANLMVAPAFAKMLMDTVPSLRKIVALGAASGVPVPAMAASLGYFDAYRTARLPQNLIQAQRDCFGAHTYQRTDDPDGPFHHTLDWLK